MKTKNNDKYSKKVYLEHCVIAYDHKNRLITAFGDIWEIHDYIKGHHIRVPPKTWVQMLEGVTSLETRPLYGMDTRTFKGYYNLMFEGGNTQ